MNHAPDSLQAKNTDACEMLRDFTPMTEQRREWLAELLEENTRALDGVAAAARRGVRRFA